MNGSGEEKPPAPPTRLQWASQKSEMQPQKPLPSVPDPEKKQKKLLKYIFTGNDDRCKFLFQLSELRLILLFILLLCFLVALSLT